jgi:hypothetical protein
VGELKPKQSQPNVNVTLDPKDALVLGVAGREIPCQLCGIGLEIRISCKQKPYCVCQDCGNQVFIRGRKGIQRLNELLNSEILISGKMADIKLAIGLFNTIAQLRRQKTELEQKQGFIASDRDLANLISTVDNEIKRVQGELRKLSGKDKLEKR